MSHKHELPGWFPYALTASFLVMIGAGIRSNWGRTAQAAPPPPQPVPPVAKAGVLQDWGF